MMTTIETIYHQFKIMPQLQEHQLRVAAVGTMICDNFKERVDKDGVIKTCLLHDMGNILKFDFRRFPQFLEPEGLDYWQKVKEDTAQKYSTCDECRATRLIVKEIGMDGKVVDYLDGVGFGEISRNVESSSFEKKICCYADMRVVPFGVVSTEERLREGKKRYAGTVHDTLSAEKMAQLTADLGKLEQQIFAKTKLKPEQINDQSIRPILIELQHYPMA